MTTLAESLQNQPIIYITRDIERALGLPLDTPGYYIISNATPFAKRVADGHPNVILIENETLLDTHDLLEHRTTADVVSRLKGADILVFKNTPFVERLCEDNNWSLLNPPAALAQSIEQKVTQLSFLPELRDLFLPYRVTTGEELFWYDKPLVVQFNHSHTGSGTKHIQSGDDLIPIRTDFPRRDMRVTEYVDGPIYTNNNAVTEHDVLIGNINYQITGLAPFTKNPFATIGNDWALPHTALSQQEQESYHAIARRVGEALRMRDWRGLFGIDVIQDAATGKLSLLEINARQPASTTYESQLQIAIGENSERAVSTFAAHLMALRNLNTQGISPTRITNGSQIIVRQHDVPYDNSCVTAVAESLAKDGYTVIRYTNTDPEADLIRIQTTDHFMDAHGVLNARGRAIVASITHCL